MKIFGYEAAFEFSSMGEITKQSYMGTFKVKCILSPMDLIRVDKMYRELLGDHLHFADKSARYSAFAFSQLHFRVLEAPEWFNEGVIKGEKIKDSNTIVELLNKCLEVEEKYIEEKKKQQEEMENKLKKSLQDRTIKKEEEKIEEET